MNDPQIWTIIAVFGAQTGFVALVLRSFRAEMNARFDAIDAKFGAKFDAVDARFDHLERAMVERMDLRFADVDHRLETIEDDMRIIKTRLIGVAS